MNESAVNGPSTKPLPMNYDVRVSVDKFGPIEKGSVDLRPLTIFVGPSNTGKTYLAILIYSLHKILHGFHRFPMMERYLYFQDEKSIITDDEIDQILDRINSPSESILYSDLPKFMRKSTLRILQDKMFLSDDLRSELERCFDIESVTNLIRMSGRDSSTKLSLSVKEEEKELWSFLLSISSAATSSRGNISDMELLSPRTFRSGATYERAVGRLRDRLVAARERPKDTRARYLLGELWDMVVHPFHEQQTETYYLPAARSGIMQSHRVIASSLVSRSTRAGFERFPELPTFSGVMADFMQRLILYDVPEQHLRFRRRRKRKKTMKDLAESLERRTLGGRIRSSRPSPGAYPEFVYRPLETKQDIRLSRASSMVSELAPVVLFMRGNISSGDTLIIEEPEAHLHPAAQTEMAATLAQLVRFGVRVVVTTHSDWLLKEIGNLMREGELEERSGESGSQNIFPSSLRPRDVGIWLFHKDGPDDGSTIREIEFDRIEGIEPSDYDAVDEQLYNRSADLQNRLEELKVQGTK